MELSNYAIDKDFRLVYKPLKQTSVAELDSNVYVVWGIGEFGLIHGSGSFLRKHEIKNKIFLINFPSYKDIENYYKNLDKLF